MTTPVLAVSTRSAPDAPAERWKKLAMLFLSSTLALLGACLFIAWHAWNGSFALNTQAALADPALRDEIVRRLSRSSIGVWDSHNDPEVGRVLQPNLRDVIATEVPMQTNSFGLREKYFDLPKPAGTLRVVLLGDSYVQGFGAEAKHRMGVFLERYLREHAPGWKGPIECLHVGIGGWNAVAECAFLRRMLTELAPDLVVHILVTNDLDDHMGVRGFGSLSAFAPLQAMRTDALVSQIYPIQFSDSPTNGNYLLHGTDHESRRHFEELAEAIGRVVPLIRRSGARYIALAHWGPSSHKLWYFLRKVLEPREFAVLPTRLLTDLDLILGPSDGHWTQAGHRVVADLIFTLIRKHDLLPQLALTARPAVEEPALVELAETWDTAMGKALDWSPPYMGLANLEPARFTDLEWSHVYTGLDAEGRVSPYASFFLLRRAQQELRVRGRAFARPELAGARLRVSVEGKSVGEHELVPGEPFDVRFPLPKRMRGRSGLNVRLETDDYVYAGPYQQHCVSFVLEQLALE